MELKMIDWLWLSELAKPESFTPYFEAANQSGHILVGLVLVLIYSKISAKFASEIVIISYAVLWEFLLQGVNGADTVRDIAFVSMGALIGERMLSTDRISLTLLVVAMAANILSAGA